MRWMFLICVLLVWSCNRSTTPASQVEADGSETSLVELALPKSDHVTVRLMFAVGSVNDPADQRGLANLTAALIADGSSLHFSKDQIDDLLYPMAVRIGSAVDKEASNFSISFHKDNREKAYAIFKDLILNPKFDGEDFERIKKNILKQVTEDLPNNNDEVLSKRTLDSLIFAGHPYGSLVQGTETGLEAVTPEKAKSFYEQHYNRTNLLIGLAGGFDEAFKAQLLADLKGLPLGESSRVTLPAVRPPSGIEARIISKERAFGSAIAMGYPLDVDRSSDDFAALMVANSYLGEHRKSYGVLYQKMRTTRSLNYGDYSYIEWYPLGHATQLPLMGYPRSQNFFSIWIRPVQIAEQFEGVEGLETPQLGNAHFVIRQSIRELAKLVENGLLEEDFQRTRKFLMGYLKLYVQSQTSRLGFLMDSRFYNRTDYIEEMIALLDKLTLEDVNGALQKYLQAENFYLAVITDDSEAEKLAASLKGNGSAPIVYKPVVKNGLPQEVLAEDEEIDAFPLNVTAVEVVSNVDMFKE